jgi:signal transduction histidine kinase
LKAAVKNDIAQAFLIDGGETGQLIRDYNWPQTSIGPKDSWPLSPCITLGNMLHSAFPMFLFWGPDRISFYNDAFRPSLGTDGKHPCIGCKAEEVWPELWGIIGPTLQQVMETGKAVWYEDVLLPFFRNGRTEDIYWTYSSSPAFGDDGQIAGVLVTCIETTKAVISRKAAESEVDGGREELAHAHESLKQANKYLQNIIDLFQEPLQVLEPVWEHGNIVDFRYKLTNIVYSAYANTTPQALKDKLVSEVFPGYLQTSSFTKNVEVFKSGSPQTWDLHYNVDGLSLHNKMSADRLGNELLVHFTDFTHVTNLQLELENKIVQLERSNRQLEEFAHAASHDLKEPVRKIQIFTAMLRNQLDGRLTDGETSTLERIERATGRMRLLIDDLLLYTHVSLNPLEKEAIDLNDTLAQVFEDLDVDIQQKNATVNTMPLPVVNGYKRQLQQLFQNLISNALKYSHKDRSAVVDIITEQASDNGTIYHVVEVKDNGIGFEQEYAEKIFQMFTRLHGKSEYSGTGVGLSIVKKIVDNHQGIIRVESTPGQGASFSVWLPVA